MDEKYNDVAYMDKLADSTRASGVVSSSNYVKDPPT